MRFSDYFELSPTEDDDWFDPVLSVDTVLFIDPFLVYDREKGFFEESHAEIISFFNSMFRLVAEAQGRPTSLRFRQAVHCLEFPEVEELCLGYTAAGTKGSGSGRGSARVIAEAIWEAIQAGIEELTHFEEIAILREGVGADRISDAVACIIRRRLAQYTLEVCERHSVPVQRARYGRGVFDAENSRWRAIDVSLPQNPYNHKPILLVPAEYLRPLPTINPDEFWDFCWSNENDTIRREFSQDVTRRVSKRDIIQLARRHPDFVRRYVQTVEQRGSNPYDFWIDERGVVQWYEASKTYCGENPLNLEVATKRQFFKVVERMVEEFRHYVEENGGWELLWHRNTSRDEKTGQRLFLGIIKHYCQANDIDVSQEPNIGRGPVDFKVSRGHTLRVLLETKLARNTRFWSGLKRQLPTYQRAEGVELGYFIVICFDDKDLDRIRGIQDVVEEVNEGCPYRVRAVIVDASPEKPSASKL